MSVKDLASLLSAYHTVSNISTYTDKLQITAQSQSPTHSIESNVSSTCVIAYIALEDSNAFCKAGRCINLNATTSLPHFLFSTENNLQSVSPVMAPPDLCGSQILPE